MEEADAFIRDYSKILECSFAEEDAIELDGPKAFEFLSRCIWRIDPSSKSVLTSHVFPRQVTQRLREANIISDYLKKFNVRADIGFQNILYGSESTLRTICLEVIKKLPSLNDESDSEDSPSLLDVISETLKNEPSWVPEFCRTFNFHYNGQHWCPPKGAPELHTLRNISEIDLSRNARQWIAGFCADNSSTAFSDPITKSEKPLLASKPNLALIEEKVQETKEVNERNDLLEKLKAKREEYEKGHTDLLKVRESNREIQERIDSYDPRLIEVLSDPDYYINQMLETLADIEKETEMEIEKTEELKKEAKEELKLVLEECEAKGIGEKREKTLEEILQETENIRKDIDRDNALIAKLEARLEQCETDNFQIYEERCKFMDEMVRKQEESLRTATEERDQVRKRHQRNEESIDRSFAIIFNALTQYVDMYRGRQALESFMRIQLYCMEMSEDMEQMSLDRIAIEDLKEKIETESRKNYDRQYELLCRDREEIEAENELLIQKIRIKKPDFKIEDL